MKRGVVVAIGGAAIVIAGLAGCSSNKGTSSVGGGKAKLSIEGKDQKLDNPTVACKTEGGDFVIAVATSSMTGLGATLTSADSPQVKMVGLGTVDGVALGYNSAVPGGGAAPTVTKDGKTYKISGSATGANVSNPTAGPVTKSFELQVTCP